MSHKKIDKDIIINIIGKELFEDIDRIKNKKFSGVNKFAIDVARQHFIEHTYEKEINEEFDIAFYELFPIEEIKKELNGVLKEIASDDEIIRLKVSKYLLKESNNEINIFRRRWIAHPLIIKTVLAILKIENNKKNIEILIQILNNISSRFNFKDVRIYNGVKEFFEEKTSKLIKTLVMSTLSNFDNPQKWEYVYEVLKNKPNKLALLTIRGILATYYRKDNAFEPNLSKEMREKLLKLLRAEDETNKDVQDSIEYLEDGRFRCYKTGTMVYLS